MAAIIFPPQSTLPAPGACDCSAPSPPFSPKFESLSDVDLEVLLIIGYLGLQTPVPTLSCAVIKAIAAPSDCWVCLSERQRQERLVAAFGNPGPENVTLVRRSLEFIERCLTPDQLQALLAYAQYQYILGNQPT